MQGVPSSKVSCVTSDTSASAATASPFSISLITLSVKRSSGMRSGARKAQIDSSFSASGLVALALSMASANVAATERG